VRKRKPIPLHVIVFLAPATIVYTCFMIFPLLDSLRFSTFAPAPERTFAFVGLANYERLTTDANWAPFLWNAIRNNFLFFAVHMLVQNPLGLLLAALLSSHLTRFKAVFRTLLFLPTVLSIVLIGFIWRLMLSPIWGISGTSWGCSASRT
jgi:raffinose/stachyose/melibiose transport system permease protein